MALSDGFLVTNNGANGTGSIQVFHVSTKCSITSTDTRYRTPLDPSDLAVGAGNTVFVADFGDAGAERATIALWKLASGNSTSIFRMSYPDGAKDARALVLGANDVPVVITAKGAIYTPSGALKAEAQAPGTALKKVGQFTPPASDTANPLGVVGTQMVTGAALSADRKKVVLRTFADAFEWDVPDGDIVKAITTGTPRRTPLPNESDGEAIAYSSDGKAFYTVSGQGGANGTSILRYAPFTPTAPIVSANANAVDDGSWFSNWIASLTLSDVNLIFAVTASIGVALIVAGVFGLRRRKASGQRDDQARRDRHDDSDDEEYDGYDGYGAVPPPTSRNGRVYGQRNRRSGGRADRNRDYPHQSDAAYGDPPAPRPGGGVYGTPRRPASGRPERRIDET